MTRSFDHGRRAIVAAACALTLAACGRPPAPQVTQPVGPIAWQPGMTDKAKSDPEAGKAGGTNASHVDAQPGTETQPAPAPEPLPLPPEPLPVLPPPVVAPVPAIPAIPITPGPTLIAFTSRLDWRGVDVAGFEPFHLGGISGLFVYDDFLKDNYNLPGAGLGIENPQVFDNGSKVLFNRVDGTIWFYDILAEIVVQFNDVNVLGVPVIRPSITFDGSVMTFIAAAGWDCAAGIAMIWINGVTAELAKVNAVGAFRGGVRWIRISGGGQWAVFTTGDGGLFVYDVMNPAVFEVTDARVAGGFATHPDISWDGSQIVWTGIDPGDGTLKIFRYDRIGGLIDPMPFANIALNAEDAFSPRFLGPDSTWITYGVSVGGHRGNFRVLGYNWLTEAVRTMTILNNVQGEGIQLVSDVAD